MLANAPATAASNSSRVEDAIAPLFQLISRTSSLPAEYVEAVCMSQISEAVPFLLGKFFSDAIFHESDQRMALGILHDVRAAFQTGLEEEGERAAKSVSHAAVSRTGACYAQLLRLMSTPLFATTSFRLGTRIARGALHSAHRQSHAPSSASATTCCPSACAACCWG